MTIGCTTLLLLTKTYELYIIDIVLYCTEWPVKKTITDEHIVVLVLCREEFLDMGPQRNVLDVDRQNVISPSLKMDVCTPVEEIP